MAWSFLWRFVVAAAVVCPLGLLIYGFVVGMFLGDGPSPPGGVSLTLALLASAAVWAYFAARKRTA